MGLPNLGRLLGSLVVAGSLASPGASQAPPVDVDEVLAFEAHELPRAEVGTWAGLLDPARAQEANAQIPMAVRQLFGEAQARYRSGDYPGTIGALRSALEQAPDLPPALQLLGTALFRLQRYGDARECFERFLLHAPGQLWRTQALGHCYYSLGLYEEARDHYGAVLADRPEGAEPDALVEARRGLALSEMRLGESDTALDHLARVVELRPDHGDAWTWIGQIHYDELHFEKALEALQEARRLDPHEPRPWYLLARVFDELDEPLKSEAARARWEELDRVAQEIRTVEARLELEPRDYDLALRLVELQKSIDNREGVRRSLSRLLLARPDNLREVDVRKYVLDTLVRMKDFVGAAEAAEAIERACPNEPETWKALQAYFARIGDPAGEIRAGERYLRLRSQ